MLHHDEEVFLVLTMFIIRSGVASLIGNFVSLRVATALLATMMVSVRTFGALLLESRVLR